MPCFARDLGPLSSLAERAFLAQDFSTAYVMFRIIAEREPHQAYVSVGFYRGAYLMLTSSY